MKKARQSKNIKRVNTRNLYGNRSVLAKYGEYTFPKYGYNYLNTKGINYLYTKASLAIILNIICERNNICDKNDKNNTQISSEDQENLRNLRNFLSHCGHYTKNEKSPSILVIQPENERKIMKENFEKLCKKFSYSTSET